LKEDVLTIRKPVIPSILYVHSRSPVRNGRPKKLKLGCSQLFPNGFIPFQTNDGCRFKHEKGM